MVFNVFNDPPSPPPNHPALSVPFNLPPPPVPLGEQRVFDCDICGRNVRVQRRREWKKHVLQDIRPYMCTFPDCPSPYETYSLQSDFLRHEIQIHLRSCHDVGVGGSGGFESLSRMGLEREELKGPSRCPFCTEGLPVEKLELGRHLGRHMEEIAFAVVSKPYEEWKFYDDSASEKSSLPRKTSYSQERAGIVRSRPNYGATIPNQMMTSSSSKITSSTQKTHKCTVCDKRFTRRRFLQKHILYSHRGEKPFACEHDGCGQRFIFFSNLRRHKKIHDKK
ncbi:hypothetical protein K440DRAFT_627729 [Wilcoxina mikolae CBS 423.85]|nr:hypothetical protein K440DRAFT_627729 [Wilcoxina mikolae CBS 423.85]